MAGSQPVLSLSYDFLLGTADNGTIAKITNGRDTNRSQNFTYDGMNRLQAAWTDGPNWGDNYVIDPWGNLTNKNQMNGKTGGEGALNQGAAVTNRFLGMSYDASGNLLFDGNNYSYDAENRIRTAAGVTYTYDGNGERVAKSNGTLYWGGSSKDALAESAADGTLTSEYVFFNGKRVARRVVATGAVFYYFSDHLGSSNVITDAGGVRQGESDFYPYGGEYVILTDSTANHYKFTGKERDETGVDYFFARYYSSNLGRFLTPDWSATPMPVPYAQLTDPQTFNLYSYVQNKPTLLSDPDGHDPGSGILLDQLQNPAYVKGLNEGGVVGAGIAAGGITLGAGIYFGGEALSAIGAMAPGLIATARTWLASQSGQNAMQAVGEMLMPPGSSSLNVPAAAEAFGFKSFEQAGNLVGGELKNGGVATAVFSRTGAELNVGVSVVKGPAGTVKELESGAINAGKASGAESVKITAKMVGTSMARLLRKEGFTQDMKNGKATGTWSKTINLVHKK